MKKVLLITGPIASFLAFKCPVCIVTLLGLGVGIGSLAPIFHTAYWVLIIGLGVIFTGFIFLSWKARTVPGWVLALGAIGLVTLVLEFFYPGGGLNIIAAVAFVIAAGRMLLNKGEAKADCCACSPLETKRANNNKGEKSCQK